MLGYIISVVCRCSITRGATVGGKRGRSGIAGAVNGGKRGGRVVTSNERSGFICVKGGRVRRLLLRAATRGVDSIPHRGWRAAIIDQHKVNGTQRPCIALNNDLLRLGYC